MDANKTGSEGTTPPAAEATIGVATMEADGTIVLQLRAEGPGMVGDAQFRRRTLRPRDPMHDDFRVHR